SNYSKAPLDGFLDRPSHIHNRLDNDLETKAHLPCRRTRRDFKKRVPIFRPFRSCSSLKTSLTTTWKRSTRYCKAKPWHGGSTNSCTLSGTASSILLKRGGCRAGRVRRRPFQSRRSIPTSSRLSCASSRTG